MTRCSPTRRGQPRLSRDAIARLVAKHAKAAEVASPSLAGKNVTPHALRHSTAMALLQRWRRHLRHRTLARPRRNRHRAQVYLHADMAIKERALARTDPGGGKLRRYTAPTHS